MCNNLLYIDGAMIVDDPHFLTCDLIHFSVYGHMSIGEHLAKIIGSHFQTM